MLDSPISEGSSGASCPRFVRLSLRRSVALADLAARRIGPFTSPDPCGAWQLRSGIPARRALAAPEPRSAIPPAAPFPDCSRDASRHRRRTARGAAPRARLLHRPAARERASAPAESVRGSAPPWCRRTWPLKPWEACPCFEKEVVTGRFLSGRNSLIASPPTPARSNALPAQPSQPAEREEVACPRRFSTITQAPIRPSPA